MIPYVVFLMVAARARSSCRSTSPLSPREDTCWSSLKISCHRALCLALASLYSEYSAIHRAGNISNKYIVYSLVPINIISSSMQRNFRSRSKPYLQIEPERTSDLSAKRYIARQPGGRARDWRVLPEKELQSLWIRATQYESESCRRSAGFSLLNGVANAQHRRLYALPEILEKNDIKLTHDRFQSWHTDRVLRELHAVRQLRVGGRNQSQSIAVTAEKCYDEDVHSVAGRQPQEPMLPGTGSSSCTWVAEATARPTVTGIPLSSSNSSPCAMTPTSPTSARIEQLYNSYDNTILYVDHVLGEIAHKLDRSGVPLRIHLLVRSW